MKLEVGMYVRTDKGFINKIKEFTPNYTKGKRRTDDYSVIVVEENYLLLEQNQCAFIENISYSIPPCYPSNEEWKEIKKHIVKYSFNIIDLIEVGDYVNGHKIIEIIPKEKTEDNLIRLTTEESATYGVRINELEIHIKSILTHEQYEANCYKVVE